jgi:hypothetical protein
MRSTIRKVLKEELTSSDKSEIRGIFKTEFDKKIDKKLKSSEFKNAVESVVLKQIGSDKKTKKEIAEITKKVLIKLYKTFWVRRNTIFNNLENA